MGRNKVDLGQRAYIEREIEQTRNLIKEIEGGIDYLTLKLTHQEGTYVQRRLWTSELYNQRHCVTYYQNKIEVLTEKLSRFDDQQKHY